MRLLAAVAGAASVKLQKLTIRRQGYGVALATLQFIELPLRPGQVLRIYTTQVDSDTPTRHQLAQVLLAHSRLGVVMVGDLPPHSLSSALLPLREAIGAGTWPNRQLLMVPLASAPGLPAIAAELSGRNGVVVRTTPQVSRPTDAWSYISGAWNRLSGNGADAPPAAADDAGRRCSAACASEGAARACGAGRCGHTTDGPAAGCAERNGTRRERLVG